MSSNLIGSNLVNPVRKGSSCLLVSQEMKPNFKNCLKKSGKFLENEELVLFYSKTLIDNQTPNYLKINIKFLNKSENTIWEFIHCFLPDQSRKLNFFHNYCFFIFFANETFYFSIFFILF